MQRWIAVGVLVMMLIFGGGVFGYWTYRQNSPAPMWVELPVNPDRTDEELKKTVKELLAKLREKELLEKVSKDLALVEKWQLASDNEAAAALSNRVFVKLGDTNTPAGRVPAVHIGVTGKKKEVKLSGEIAMRLMNDVWKILGIKPPPAN
ncbi:MAG: hypothetical protein V4689_17515 [Verrucomicrobiota bacterium]